MSSIKGLKLTVLLVLFLFVEIKAKAENEANEAAETKTPKKVAF